MTTSDGLKGFPADADVAPVKPSLTQLVLQGQYNVKRENRDHYAHRAHFEKLLNFGTDMKKDELMAALWYEDTPNHLTRSVLQTSVLQCTSSFL